MQMITHKNIQELSFLFVCVCLKLKVGDRKIYIYIYIWYAYTIKGSYIWVVQTEN